MRLGGGLYRAVMGRAYHAMLNAAIAALLDEKYHRYFSQAFNSRTEPDDPAFTSADHRQAQTNLLRVKEFVAACRILCD